MKGSTITQVTARQVLSGRGHPAVEAMVVTAGGSVGRAQCTAGVSVGTHEVAFTYDGGNRWRGKGVGRAVENVNRIIAPAIIGMDAADQTAVDNCILSLGGTDAKHRLGGNAVAAVSAAVLQAGARALDIPLYRHIGGEDAVTLPCASTGAMMGSDRYLPISCGKPTYSFIAYDFPSFGEACYAVWEVFDRWQELLNRKWGLSARLPSAEFPSGGFICVPKGLVQTDAALWDMMTETVCACGYENRLGLQMDLAADSYYDPTTGIYQGLFDAIPRDRDALIGELLDIIRRYPFVVLEDPLNENDYEGHAILTSRADIQIVGDDLFTTNPERVLEGIRYGSCNTVLLKVNQIGSITEALDMVRLAHSHGYQIMPCSSRGEDLDICDYSVGINAGSIRETCYGSAANRFLEIERELGSRARFAGKAGLQGERFHPKTEKEAVGK